ncbi:hypothetical protein Tco_1564637, partial [Tanacetum coccineum]
IRDILRQRESQPGTAKFFAQIFDYYAADAAARVADDDD